MDDLVDGVVRLLAVDCPTPVNLGNPEEYTVLDLALLVRELTGSKSAIVTQPLPIDDPRRRRPDIGVAQRVLGWSPRVSVRDGLLRTIAHYRVQRPQLAAL